MFVLKVGKGGMAASKNVCFQGGQGVGGPPTQCFNPKVTRGDGHPNQFFSFTVHPCKRRGDAQPTALFHLFETLILIQKFGKLDRKHGVAYVHFKGSRRAGRTNTEVA